MKAHILFTFALVMAASAVSHKTAASCTGAPTYSCGYTGTTVVQTPTPPFTAATPAGTVVKLNVFNGTYMSRVTDPNTGGSPCSDNEWSSTSSGGSYDVITNTTETLLIIDCGGGVRYVVGFNPTTLQVFAPTSFPEKCQGTPAFSRTNPLVLYCRPDATNPPQQTPIGPANGTTIYKLTFSYAAGTNLCGTGVGKCPDPTVAPTWAVLTDLANCPQAPKGTETWGSILGVGASDNTLGESLSWSAGQGTARYFFFWQNQDKTCSTFDLQGNGSHPIWYSQSGTAHILTAINATAFVHDATINGGWAAIEMTNCAGSSCGTGDGPLAWNANTNTVVMFSATPGSSGHHDMSKSYFFNDSNPAIMSHPLTNPATATQAAETNCTPCTEVHFSADIYQDAYPLVGSTSSPNAIWTAPYKNVVFAAGSGKIWQFCPTFSSGLPTTGFSAQYGITGVGQLRDVAFLTSDMLGTLGKTATGLNRWDVFACGLRGQGVATASIHRPTKAQ
jgi:hypothetical protein